MTLNRVLLALVASKKVNEIAKNVEVILLELKSGNETSESLRNACDYIYKKTIKLLLSERHSIDRTDSMVSARQVALNFIYGISEPCIISGQYHSYRGILDDVGSSFLFIMKWILERKIEAKVFTPDEVNSMLMDLQEQIDLVG